MNQDLQFMSLAVEQARIGAREGGLPIGAALVCDGTVLGVGRNRLVQQSSVIRHAETDCLENAGPQPPDVYARCTLYTTMSPCQMCAGAVLLHQVPRVVIGENRSWQSSEEHLRAHGVDVVVLDLEECVDMMNELLARHPELWSWG
ncbi:nucleoside deaminase [Mycobacterium aquaticum]|uniref:nucleoside deaminase n=1 Tax=Mycobacterium aquaticum TaxID=1927124 RepID=UPI001FEA37CE|nr:nucleoside deaminase [Mycobacterium aquaticum]